MYAAIDIHKHVFQAAVLDPETGEVKDKSRKSGGAPATIVSPLALVVWCFSRARLSLPPKGGS